MPPAAAPPQLELVVLSLRYSSWSMRPWLALQHAGAAFATTTVELPHMQDPGLTTSLAERRARGSVRGLFPVLRVDGASIHESLAICEYVAERFPEAGLWPDNGLRRAEARAISCEMLSGFQDLRRELSCHVFARVPAFAPGAAARADIERIFEIWREKLDRSGGPFLFGRFGVADAMFFPVLTRFRTYAVALPPGLEAYAHALDTLPAVRALLDTAREAPRIAVYDNYVTRLGGDADGAISS